MMNKIHRCTFVACTAVFHEKYCNHNLQKVQNNILLGDFRKDLSCDSIAPSINTLIPTWETPHDLGKSCGVFYLHTYKLRPFDWQWRTSICKKTGIVMRLWPP